MSFVLGTIAASPRLLTTLPDLKVLPLFLVCPKKTTCMSSMSVTCPPGFAPGAAFVVQDPSTGQQMQVVVPDGIMPGQTFQVQVPLSVPAPVPMAQPYVEQQYAPYAPQPVAPQQVNINMMQPLPQAPIIINNNNNDNNINTMQAPTPQQMYTHEPSTEWQSGLFECCDDIPVCASRPAAAHAKKLAPALRTRARPSTPKGLRCMSLPPLMSYSDVSSPLGTGFGVSCFFPCAYGMLVDMHMNNKVLSGRTDSILSIVFASPLLSSCPSDRVAGGRTHALRQLRRVLGDDLLALRRPRQRHLYSSHLLIACLFPLLFFVWPFFRLLTPHHRRGQLQRHMGLHLSHPHLNPQQAQPKGARHSSV